MRRATAVVAVLIGVVLAASPAFAIFDRNASSATGAFTTAVLEPATGVAVSWSCTQKKSDYTATITWTASTSSFATGYEVAAAPSAAGPWTVIATTTDTTATEADIPRKTDRWYAVTALAHGWRSAPAEIHVSSPNPPC